MRDKHQLEKEARHNATRETKRLMQCEQQNLQLQHEIKRLTQSDMFAQANQEDLAVEDQTWKLISFIIFEMFLAAVMFVCMCL